MSEHPPDPEVTPVDRPEKSVEVKVEGHVSVIALIVAALVTAVFAFLLGMARRKATIERNKALLAEEDLVRLKEQHKMLKNEENREQTETVIKGLEEEVKISRGRLEKLDKQHEAYVKKLKEVNSWDELFKD